MERKSENKHLEMMMHCAKYLSVVEEQHQEDYVTIYSFSQFIKKFMVSIEKHYFQQSVHNRFYLFLPPTYFHNKTKGIGEMDY